MSIAPQMPAVPIPAPPLGWLQRLRANLDEHVFFWIMLLIALYVFFGVPQITNVWQQWPPWKSGLVLIAGYLIFLSFLIGFYGLSTFVVIRRFPVRWVQERVEAFVSRRMNRWQEQGLGRFYRPSYWLAAVTWRAPDLCCRWLVWAVSNPEGRRDVPKVAVGILGAVLVGSTALLFGTRSDASRAYPLAGAFCQNMALLNLAAAVWLMVTIPTRLGGAVRPGEVGLYFGRFLAWLISTALFGELLWVLADTNWWDNLISYRLYTIWAVFQLLTTLVITGLLIDRWHDATDRWPVRQVAFLLLPVLVWLFSRALPVDSAELDRHLTPDQVKVWKEIRAEADGPQAANWHSRWNKEWFTHLNSRVQQVPELDPVVIVAASGGGSRAAIFTSLVLETLARTPTKDPSTGRHVPIANDPRGTTQRTWADNIVLISSVSGGSLATAYHVERRAPQTPPEMVPESPSSHERVLRNTAARELKHWGVRQARELIQTYLVQPPDGFPVDDFSAFYKLASNPELALEALKKGEQALSTQLTEFVDHRDKMKTELKKNLKLSPTDAKKLAQGIEDLSEKIAARRTALALLDGYRSLDEQAPDRPTDPLGRWIWTSQAFDEMCVDFMAPITRGVLTPALDRGDALARFWTHRFGWYDCTNFSGYHRPLKDGNYGGRPAVVFNAVDVARGSRLAVGFPILPSDLWDKVYQQGVTREVPRALNAPVSLARAVRMSSNFPYGFRAMEFTTPTPVRSDPAARLKPDGGQSEKWGPVHVLDGGVVDNTGLDTIYELLAALEYHADPKHADAKTGNPYQTGAAALLANLRRHGVCILEIDAGAKPNTALPWPLDLFGGVKEQSQSLENGGYSNADRAKQLYLKEIRRILTQRLEEPSQPSLGSKTSLCDLEDGLPPTALHYCFQCNHYQPGGAADPAIMTAWALGPRDKAGVVARFLPELGVWDRRREQLWDDITEGKDGVTGVRQLARLRVLRDRVVALSQVLYQLSLDLADLEMTAQAGQPVAPDKLSPLRDKLGDAKEKLVPLEADIGGETNTELREEWKKLDQQVRLDEERLARLAKARTADQREQLKAGLEREPNLARQSKELYEQIGTRMRAAEVGAAQKVTAELRQSKLLDPQLKYDQANRQAKEVFRPGPP
jgi:hypothetical protein